MSAAYDVEARAPQANKSPYSPPLRVVHEEPSERHAEALDLMAKVAIRRQRMKPGPDKYAV